MEQTSIFNQAKEPDELVAYRLYVEQVLMTVSEDWYLPEEALSAAFFKDKSKFAVKVSEYVICRFKFSGKLRYIEIPKNYTRFLPDGTKVKTIASDNAFCRIHISDIAEVEKYTDTFVKILDSIIFSIPKEFSCCDRYLACSDARKCVHSNREAAIGCYYKKVLKSGRVFYGKNRNI